MAVSQYEFEKLWAINPSATIAAKNAFGSISAIRIKVSGIKGGRGGRSRTKITYSLYIDVDKIRSNTFPTTWIESPSDSQITHVNIWHPKMCPKLGRELPWICEGDNADLWSMRPKSERTLVVLCDILHHILMNQDFDSPARSV